MASTEQKQVATLLVEDNLGDAFLLRSMLADAPDITFDLTHVERLTTAIEYLKKETFDLILLDLSLPDSEGLETFLILEKLVPYSPIILLTGLNDESIGLEAVRAGAQDYLVKGKTNTKVLLRSVSYALERIHHLDKIHQSEIRLQQANQKLAEQIKNRTLELKSQNQKLKKLYLQATVDKLTGIANRHCLEDFLYREWGNAIRNQISVSLIMIDIDRFKVYNDTFGHQAGDICLRQVAQTIKQTIKRPKDLVARYGGEEFIVILSDTDLDGAINVAENVRSQIKALSIPHSKTEMNKINHCVTISLGVSQTTPQINSQASDLIAAADKALYLAKQKGRDRVEMYQI